MNLLRHKPNFKERVASMKWMQATDNRGLTVTPLLGLTNEFPDNLSKPEFSPWAKQYFKKFFTVGNLCRADDPQNLKFVDYCIRIPETSAPIGYTSWYDLDKSILFGEDANLLYGIDPEHQGKGYATRAMHLMKGLAQLAGFKIVKANAEAQNLASLHILANHFGEFVRTSCVEEDVDGKPHYYSHFYANLMNYCPPESMQPIVFQNIEP